MAQYREVLVSGATGQQGGALTRKRIAHGYAVCVREPGIRPTTFSDWVKTVSRK